MKLKMSLIKSDCPKCKNKIDPDSNFCINCGFSINNNNIFNKKTINENRFGANLISDQLQNPTERNLQIIAVFEFIMGSFFFISAFVIIFASYYFNKAIQSNKEFLSNQFNIDFFSENNNDFLEILFFIILFAFLLYGVLCVAFGLGLYYMKKWGKTGTMVISGIGMLIFPIGTLAGGLLIYYLTRKEIDSFLT
jgi:hypothetical protein